MDVAADFTFDNWTFRRQPPELLRDGTRIRLQEQPLQVLSELIARPGELVTREYLIARLWPKRVVEFDAGLNAAVRRLRAALGDEAETPRYIETVPRKGYRFIGKLRPAAVEMAHPQPVKPFWRPGKATFQALRIVAVATIVIALSAFGIGQWRELNVADSGGISAGNEELRRADFFVQRRAAGDLARARQLYERASSLNPTSARAWAGLASVDWLEIAQGEQTREINLPKIRVAAQRALDLDPRSAEAHLRMGHYLCATGNSVAARQHWTKAVELQPNDPLVLAVLAGSAADDFQWEEAIVLQRRAEAASPLSTSVAANLAHFLFLAGRWEEAKQEFEKVIALDPTHPNEILVFTQILEGHYDEALRNVETWADGAVRDHSLALIYHGLGRAAESSERLDRLIATGGSTEPTRVAEVYAFRGEADNAFQWLGSPQSSLGVSPALYASPFLKPLQSDPRWAKLTQRTN